MYSIQSNRFGVIIVCRGDVVRQTYRILFTTHCYADAVRYQSANNLKGK